MGKLLKVILSSVGLLLVLNGCGGEAAFQTNGTVDQTGSGGGGESSALSVGLALVDPTTGNTTAAISSSNPGKLVITVNYNGAPLANALVSAKANLSTFVPAAGTALTDASGVADLGLEAGTTAGADTVTASVTYNGVTTEQTLNYEVLVGSVVTTTVDIGSGSGTSFVPKAIDLGGVSVLSAGGTVTATVNIVETSNNNALYTTPVDVTFTSTCVAAGQAVMDSPITTANGSASSTYRAAGCVGSDTITATADIGGTIYSATGNLTVQPPTVGSIQFVSATPEVIALQGTGGTGLAETSTVIFEVQDEAGNVVPNQDVSFNLSTQVGGISLSPATASTNAAGQVQTVVNSGTVNTSVIVTATVAASNISTQSVALAVSTGVPDQNSFSIAAESLNPWTWNCNGVEVGITAFVADHFNNPAPDGTAVAFQTEGGVIDGSCITSNGQCRVTWVSSDPRPTDGRATILATVIGEEGFADNSPSNGRFDDGETFTDLPEAWRDDDEDGVKGAGEEYIDFNNNGSYDGVDGTYNGTLCSSGSTICNANGDLVHVRDSLVLVMASNGQIANLYETSTGSDVAVGNTILLPDSREVRSFRVDLQDARGQIPPAGTSITVTTSNGEIMGGTTTEIGSSNLQGPASLGFSMRADKTPDQGVLTITVNIPGNNACGTETLYWNVNVDDSLDVTPPSVASSDPKSGDSAVAVDKTPIEVTFSEGIEPSTINTTTVTLTGATSVMGTLTYDSTTQKAFFFPSTTLSADTLYTLTVNTGVTDSAGNAMASDYTAIFKTAP